MIHGSHNILSTYYAKLPNEYLEAIVRYAGKFREHCKIKNVLLQRSQRFHMRDTNQRVKFFRLLARLLFYLASGKSHCGYLFNYDDNPIHSLVSPYSHFCFDWYRLPKTHRLRQRPHPLLFQTTNLLRPNHLLNLLRLNWWTTL